MNRLSVPYFNHSASVYVLVFKTNIRFKKDLEIVRQIFRQNPSVFHWTIDSDDDDKILRIESDSSHTAKIIADVKAAGFFCEELAD